MKKLIIILLIAITSIKSFAQHGIKPYLVDSITGNPTIGYLPRLGATDGVTFLNDSTLSGYNTLDSIHFNSSTRFIDGHKTGSLGWIPQTDLSYLTNNIGSGFRLVSAGTNNIKTLFCSGCTFDSTTNTNGITLTVTGGGGGLSGGVQQVVPVWSGSSTLALATNTKLYFDTTNQFLSVGYRPVTGMLELSPTYIGTAATNGTTTLTGTGTAFLTAVQPGMQIVVNAQTKTITAVASNTSLTVNSSFSGTGSGYTYKTTVGTDTVAWRWLPNGNAISFGNITIKNVPTASSFGFGTSALQAQTTGNNNTANGSSALYQLTTGTYNTAMGATAGGGIISGSNNSLFGAHAGLNATASDATGIGFETLYATSGTDNTAVGYYSLRQITSGTYNVGIGSKSLNFLYDGTTAVNTASNTISIGYDTRANAANETNSITIAGIAGQSNGSNTTTIGSNATTQANLYGSIEIPMVAAAAPTLSTSTSGGLITAATYRYILTANDAAGSVNFYGTISSGITTTGSTSTITVTFPTLPVGAVSWNIYRTTTTTFGASSLIATGQTGATYVDGAASPSSGSPNTIITAFTTKFSNVSGASNWINNGGALGIGTVQPDASAKLDVTSTTRGFLPPRMTTTQRNAISSPAEGLMVYDLTLHKLYVYDGTTWQAAW